MALATNPPPPSEETIEYVDIATKLQLTVKASTFF